MSESTGTLDHPAFLEELSANETGTPAWRAASAGLAVLRLVRACADGDPSAVTADVLGLRAVRAAVEEVTERAPARAILSSAVDALEASPSANLQTVAPRLIAYGQALELDAKLALAADVYRLVIAYTHPVEDADVAIMAHLRLGLCLRALNDMPRAMLAFDTASRLATAIGDTAGVLRARIGEAQIAMRRGNLPRAEALLDDTIAHAVTPELRDVRSRALHDRSTIAHCRGDYRLAAQLAFDALESSVSPSERERIMSDLALHFSALGVLSAARDAYLVLAATAQQQIVRWASALNLMEIAAREMVQPTFERYRRELEDAALPPDMRTAFCLTAGQGYVRLGEPEQARAYLQRARTLAHRFGHGQLLFAAEQELETLATRGSSVPEIPAEVPEALAGVASRIRRMREAGSMTEVA